MLPRLLDGCTGCRACADICPDYVFEVYRFDHVDDPSTRRGELTVPLVLREGYDAIAEAAVDVGCRFFAGYPMLPFTGLLDAFTRELEPVGGVMIQSDTEIEGVNMALGAAATGARAATGSTGQGVALMQEAIAEAALNELPLVIFTMAPRPTGLLPVARAAAGGATTARSRLAPVERGRGRRAHPARVRARRQVAHSRHRSTATT